MQEMLWVHTRPVSKRLGTDMMYIDEDFLRECEQHGWVIGKCCLCILQKSYEGAIE